ncbi:hypothetical protein CC2G_012052 [Coprinopsis cinerea AmutBmut pab1-1]|nr:hypothetical protein CC2G_012052 [Coprinopsis cinerea AmutBmut pab1-1]
MSLSQIHRPPDPIRYLPAYPSRTSPLTTFTLRKSHFSSRADDTLAITTLPITRLELSIPNADNVPNSPWSVRTREKSLTRKGIQTSSKFDDIRLNPVKPGFEFHNWNETCCSRI